LLAEKEREVPPLRPDKRRRDSGRDDRKNTSEKEIHRVARNHNEEAESGVVLTSGFASTNPETPAAKMGTMYRAPAKRRGKADPSQLGTTSKGKQIACVQGFALPISAAP